jgi:hypothetical protein
LQSSGNRRPQSGQQQDSQGKKLTRCIEAVSRLGTRTLRETVDRAANVSKGTRGRQFTARPAGLAGRRR